MEFSNTHPTALDALFWRDEILQVLYWMQGEGLGDQIQAKDLLVWVNGDLATLIHHLEKCTQEGYLNRMKNANGALFSLSERGKREAGQRFRDAFQGMQKVGHGECGPDCDCNWEGHEACPAHQQHHHHA